MFKVDMDILKDLNDSQRKVCIYSGNVLLTACPGSGKTRTILYRLAYLKTINPNSKLLDIAITYTNRAANEITERLENMGIDMSAIWVGTIHKFCMEFIIRPYAMYLDDLKKGFHIIDEYIKRDYCTRISNELKIDTGYNDPLSNPQIYDEYMRVLHANKEIDFDMILDFSIKLFLNNPFIAENISSIIRSIHVDEYQDTNEKQYNILKLIVEQNKNINLLFVGDVNQAIFSELGGVAKTREELEKLYKVSFEEMVLDGCYRSTQRMIDYYCNFEVQHTRVTALSDLKNDSGIIMYDKKCDKNDLAKKIATIINTELQNGISESEICVIAPQWYQIFPMAVQLRKLIPNVSFDAPEISPFKYDPMNPFYLLSRLVYAQAGCNSQRRKRLVYEFFNILSCEYRITKPENFDVHDFLKIVNSASKEFEDGVEVFKLVVELIFKRLNVDFTVENELYNTYMAFLGKVYKRISDYALPHRYDDLCKYFKEREGIVITSIHSVKGEEFHTVIAFDLLNMHLPHSSYIYEQNKKTLREEHTYKILYVLCSRAKKNLYLFSEKGRTTKKGTPLKPTDELCRFSYSYDTIFD